MLFRLLLSKKNRVFLSLPNLWSFDFNFLNEIAFLITHNFTERVLKGEKNPFSNAFSEIMMVFDDFFYFLGKLAAALAFGQP